MEHFSVEWSNLCCNLLQYRSGKYVRGTAVLPENAQMAIITSSLVGFVNSIENLPELTFAKAQTSHLDTCNFVNRQRHQIVISADERCQQRRQLKHRCHVEQMLV